MRGPFEGVLNIIRFNWHLYATAALATTILIFLGNNSKEMWGVTFDVLAGLIISSTSLSLLASYYIYDFSPLYNLSWMDRLKIKCNGQIANIHAGFDETSSSLNTRFPHCKLFVFDFYDPKKHTEISIERARKIYQSFPGTQKIETDHLPLQSNSIDKVFAIFSLHEIRNDTERNAFFRELRRVLTATGQIIVTEHLRDRANLVAYNIGAFHFHSKATWKKAFQAAGLRIVEEIKITPFITTFVLEKNAATS